MWKTRLDIADYNGSIPEEQEIWDSLSTALMSLTAGGMSSDESDSGDRSKPAIVRIRPWRSHELLMAMRFLDRKRKTMTISGAPKPGTAPHARDRHSALQIVSARLPTPNLPINFYDPAWFDNLPQIEQEALGALEEVPLPDITEEHLR